MIATDESVIGGRNILIQSDEKTAFDNLNVNSLIIRCHTDKDSLETLYNMFKKGVFALAFSIVGDYHLAEDCVAETFIRLTQVKHFSEKKGDGKGFIYKVARNVSLELYRKFKKNFAETNIVIQSYGETDQKIEDCIFINQLLKNLNEKQKQIIILKCYNDLTFKEIAKILKSPESTVKSRYQKAIEILQKKAGVNK